MRVPPLGREDPLEKEMASYSRILENSKGRGAWLLQSMGPQIVRHDRASEHGHTSTHIH